MNTSTDAGQCTLVEAITRALANYFTDATLRKRHERGIRDKGPYREAEAKEWNELRERFGVRGAMPVKNARGVIHNALAAFASPVTPAAAVPNDADRKLYIELLSIADDNRRRRENGEPIVRPLDLIASHRTASPIPPATIPGGDREAVVARIIELAIVRHGVAESDIEGTLDDADAILALTSTGEASDEVQAEIERLKAEACRGYNLGYADGLEAANPVTVDAGGVEQIAAAIFGADPDTGCTWAEWLAYVDEHPTFQQSVDFVRRQAEAVAALAHTAPVAGEPKSTAAGKVVDCG